MENDELIVEGCRFNSVADAARAREEVKKAAYIRSKMNYNDPESALAIYEKMLSNKIFITPPGGFFLKEVRDRLIYSGIEEERIPAVPLSHMYSFAPAAAAEEVRPRRRVVPEVDKDLYRNRFIVSACVNVILLLAIVAMFVIAITSANPNVLNYERAVQDKYAAWEQDLTEREKEVRYQEKKLLEEER